MAGHPKKKRILELLQRLAIEEFGAGAEPLDLIRAHLAGGGTLAELAATLTTLSSEPVHRSWLNGILLSLSPDAESRMNEARKQSAHLIVEQAQEIADATAVEPTRESIASAKLRADFLQWKAARWNRAVYGDAKQADLQISIGQLHLDALRARNAEREREASAAAKRLPSPTEALSAGDDKNTTARCSL